MRDRNLGILPDASSRLPSLRSQAGKMLLDATAMVAVLQFRFAHKFSKLSAGAKRGNSKQIYRGCVAVSREISARVCAKRFVPRRALVCALQRTQWRMVGKRAIQLRVVRPIFRALSFLAPVAGQAGAGSRK
jgi:hypothetical protein